MDIRPLGRHDGLEADFDLARRAFGPLDPSGRAGWLAVLQAAADDGRCLTARDGPQTVAAAVVHDMRQWRHGRPLRMAGVSGVKVAAGLTGPRPRPADTPGGFGPRRAPGR